MKKKYGFLLPHLGSNEQKYVQEAFDANWITSKGANLDGFEQELVTVRLVGDLSSSVPASCKMITQEIKKALLMNEISFSEFKIQFRFFWKIIGFVKKW